MSIFRNLFGSKEKIEKPKEEKRQPDEVEALITTLQYRNEFKGNYDRVVAAKALAKIGDVRAIEPLITALKDEGMQKEMAEALGQIGSPAVEPLITALKDSDADLRAGAAIALGEIKDVRSVEPLITALKDSNADVRSGAAIALGEIKDVRSVEPLITALKDSDADLRVEAAYALGLINDARAVKPLITALKDSHADVRRGAAWALGEIKDVRAVKPLITAFHDEYEDVRKEAAGSLGEIGAPAVEPLITALKKSNADVRMGATIALGEIKDVRSVEPLITALKDSNADVQMGAEKALAKIGGLTADQAAEVQQARVPQAETLMKKFVEVGVELERNAFTRFAKHGFSELGTTNDLSKIKESSKALQDCGTAAVDPLCNFLESYNVGGFDLTFACKEAIFVLGNLGDKKAIPAIEKFASIHSYAEDVANEAIKKLGGKLS